MLGRQDMPSFVVQDALMPLDDYMERDGISGDLFYESEFRGCQFDGKTWILPLPTGGALNIMWRNKQWIADEGFDPETPPETWEDMMEMGRAITVLENGSLQKAFFRATVFGGPGAMIGWMHSNGGSWVSDDLRTVQFNSQEALEALTFVVDYTNEINGGIEEQNIFFSQTGEWENGPFYSYFEAMQVNGSWEFFKIQEYAPDIIPHLGVSVVPHGPSGESHGTAHGGWGYCAPRGVKNPEESWLLVKWLTTAQDGACWFLQQQKRPSPLISCNEDPVSGEGNPVWDDIIETMSQDIWMPISPVQPEVQALWDTAQEEALYGLRTPEEALEWCAGEVQDLLDTFWAEHS
jgi:multiple sugar transport system substrate-binding protein